MSDEKTYPPNDIKHFDAWLSFVRQMQSKARSQQGLAALTTTVFVNQDGRPIQWLPPIKTELHPKGNKDEFLIALEAHNLIKRQTY